MTLQQMAGKANAVFCLTSVFPPLLSPALEAVFGIGGGGAASMWLAPAPRGRLCDLQQGFLLQGSAPKTGFGKGRVLEVWCLLLQSC